MNTKSEPLTNNATNTSVDDLLNETGLGKVIAENKTLVIGLVALIIVGVFGFGFYQSKHTEGQEKLSNAIFTFGKDAKFDPKEKGFDAQKLHDDFLALLKTTGSYAGAIESVLIVSESLREAGKIGLANNVLSTASKQISSHPGRYFIDSHLASTYEDLGKLKEALEVNQRILKSGSYFLEDQVYFNIGRLELKLGNKDKAKTSFEYIVKKGDKAEGEFLKLSKLFLDYRFN